MRAWPPSYWFVSGGRRCPEFFLIGLQAFFAFGQVNLVFFLHLQATLGTLLNLLVVTHHLPSGIGGHLLVRGFDALGQ